MAKDDFIIEEDGKRFIRLYHFMPAKYLYDMLAKDEVKIAIPEECNDPLEFMPAGDASEGDYSRPPGAFVSFSTKCSSSLMWAHYADAHKGVCLEFTFPLCGGLAHLSDGIKSILRIRNWTSAIACWKSRRNTNNNMKK